jgi:alpha-mannosidase
MQAFVTLESEKRSLAVATRGLAEYEVLRDGKSTLAITLLRAVGEVGDWGVFPTPKGQKKGEWTLEYALVPYADERGDAYSEAYAFAYPSAVATVCGAPAEASTLLAYDEPLLRLSAFKRAEDGDGTVLRLFSLSDETLTVPFETAFARVTLANLAEEEAEEIPVEAGAFTLTVPPHRIVTLRLR